MGYLTALALWFAVMFDAPITDAADGRFIRHTLRSGESVSELAERYGVTLDQLAGWNDGASPKDWEKGDVLRIKPARLAPPRQRRRVRVGGGDNWHTIATKWGVTVDALRLWNPKYAKKTALPKGARLLVWLQSGLRQWPEVTSHPELPPVPVIGHARSIGSPGSGRLENGVALPKSDDYTVRISRLAYGTSLTVTSVQRAIHGFRHETAFEGDIVIGAMSRKTGRRLSPHKSHQSGRDVDVRLPAMSFSKGHYDLAPHEIDWHACVALIDAFVRTETVAVIFLERKLWRYVKDAALRMGYSDTAIGELFDHIRHSRGHTAHMHVRFECDPTAPRCKDG